ncbi:MAG: DegT/DnrJ/EryC1/StrS family aminotransferase, partial [Bacteroidales bacterium]
NGVEIRPMFYPLSSHKYLLQESNIILGDETIARQLNAECFILPSYPGLTNKEVDHIINVVELYLKFMQNSV